jgi:hypothetical protein
VRTNQTSALRGRENRLGIIHMEEVNRDNIAAQRLNCPLVDKTCIMRVLTNVLPKYTAPACELPCTMYTPANYTECM